MSRRLAELDRRVLGAPAPARDTPRAARVVNAVLAGAMVLLTAYVGVLAVTGDRVPRWPIAGFAGLLAGSVASSWADARR